MEDYFLKINSRTCTVIRDIRVALTQEGASIKTFFGLHTKILSLPVIRLSNGM